MNCTIHGPQFAFLGRKPGFFIACWVCAVLWVLWGEWNMFRGVERGSQGVMVPYLLSCFSSDFDFEDFFITVL